MSETETLSKLEARVTECGHGRGVADDILSLDGECRALNGDG